eukprot:TRINITY_DN11646_c0_g1_i1.p1 TRINITY_DN11646_c0_g1~~TRINITY_DN11646_c0_g1_i1.p1  ORF type:complete len:139 (+),score=20.80 TRINITY_DN11646_c0_g1_i1:127-543(+)
MERNKPKCRFFAAGRCKYGSECRFSHEPAAPKSTAAPSTAPKKQPCKYFKRGYCANGSKCRFSHVGGASPMTAQQKQRAAYDSHPFDMPGDSDDDYGGPEYDLLVDVLGEEKAHWFDMVGPGGVREFLGIGGGYGDEW